jgi:quercetin dioxygenase-like cupin family protein
MDRDAFEAQLARDGFEILEKSMPAGILNPDHTHPFLARLLVLSGTITVSREGRQDTFGPGDIFEVAANQVHSERVGNDEDVVYVLGSREAVA